MSAIGQDVREAVTLLRQRPGGPTFRSADLRWLGSYVRPHVAPVGAAAALLILVAAVAALVPAATMYIIDRALPKRDLRTINVLLIGLALLYVLRPIASFLATYNFTVLGESEQRVWRAAERLFAGRTRIVISHRLSPVLAADRIVLLEGGRVVAIGTQDELLATSDLYRGLFSIPRAAETACGQATGAMLMGEEGTTSILQSNKFRQAYERTCQMLGVEPLPVADSISAADLGVAATVAAGVGGRTMKKPA
jgi:hypothetical protein